MAPGEFRPRHTRQISRNPRVASNTGRNVQITNGSVEESDKQTISYIKRVLCSGKTGSTGKSNKTVDSTPLEDLLPPLTSSNELDIQLYATIAIIINQFVNSWYTQITLDSGFVDEIVNIIAHCTRGIEQRLKHVDLEELLLDELPALMLGHIDAVTTTLNACANDRSEGDARQIFHSLRPNQALAPAPDSSIHLLEQQENEIAWSQLLVSRILPLVLPPEDLQNPCLHVLVSDVLSQAIVYNAICERASEAWVIWEGVTKLLNSLLRPSLVEQAVEQGNGVQPQNRLQQFGLLSSTEAKQHEDPQKERSRRIDVVLQALWTIAYLLSIAWLLLRSLATALMHDSSSPARSSRQSKSNQADKVSVAASGADSEPGPQQYPDQGCDKPPIARMRIWPCISRLTMLEQRMPWLSGLLSLLQWLSLHGPGEVCGRDGVVDRLLASEIQAQLQRPDLLPRVLLATRSALFPNNALATARTPPTSAEALDIRRKCAEAVVDAIPRSIRRWYFATGDEELMQRDVEGTLDLFSDPYINRHFIVSAVELLAVRLFPELEEVDGEI